MRDLIRLPARRGMTLVELLVALSLLAILASVATLAVRVVSAPKPDDPARVIADSLRVSVATGRSIVVRMTIHDRAAVATVYPDGSVFADSAYRIDPMIGRGKGSGGEAPHVER
jgi:prepilin-type N-terminal cleavage/methylation domain-containing protein